MSGMKIESLAKTIGIDPEQLVKQLQEAGVPIKVSTDEITEAQKQTLLAFLQQRHGKTETNPTAAPRKMTLKRKSTSEIKVAGTARLAGSKSVNVEVRKKRTYIKRTPAEAAAEEATARKTKLAAEAAAELEASRQEREMNARKQERIDADKRKEAADVAAEEAMKVAAKAEAEAVEAEAAAEEAAEVEAAAQVKAEAEKAEAASKVEKIAKPDETKADKTKADKTKADKTKADKTKADKTEADKTEADKTEADKTEEKPVEVAPEPVVAAPVVPERTTAQKLADADAKRRAANKARVEAEKALIERRRLRAEEEALEKERKEARKKEEAEAKALEAKQKAAATKTDKDKPEKKKFNNPAAAKTDNNRRGGRKKGSKYDREELHVSKGRGGRNKKRGGKIVIESDNEHGFSLPTEAVVHTVEVPDTISVGELAQRMSVKSVEVIKSLMGLGTMATINQILDQDTATIVIEEMGHIAKPVVEDALEVELENISEGQMGEAVKRAPVVTVMGHVDHGKTSLLDYIRSAKVTAGEAGGITQHIGAYKVILDEGEITFLDTPGHAAFTEMRTRGANATDIVIIVVAADDGVMPQTIEAVKLAKAANATIIVAVNKMDKEQANPDRVKQELSNYDVIPEDWGGDVPFVPLSALTGQGVDDLLEIINLQAEVLEFKAPVVGPASGVVIESRLDKGRGTIVTVLVQSGTLNRGDVLVVGQEFGRVRAMFNEHGEAMQTATPSTPVEVLGLSGTPSAGDSLQVAPDERKAREIANARVVKAREIKIGKQQAAKLDEMFNKMESGDVQTLNVVVKADVHGSAEAVQQALTNLSTDLVRVRVVSTGVGGINETDAQLAVSSDAILIGFNVRADNAARRVITERGLDVQYFSIIYDLIDVVTTAMTGMLAPVYKDEIIGLAQVNEVFSSPKFGDIAGSIVLEGKIKRSNPIRVLRDNVVIYEGELESLRRFKDDVKEVASGVECGIGVKDYKDVQAGDQIEVYERVLMTPKL